MLIVIILKLLTIIPLFACWLKISLQQNILFDVQHNNNVITVTKATKSVKDGQEDRHNGTYYIRYNGYKTM